MAFTKDYVRINWEDAPSTATPINADNLNKIDSAIDKIEDYLQESDATEVEWNQLVTEGDKIAEITIDGEKTDVIVPKAETTSDGIGNIKRVSLNDDIFTDKILDNINVSITSLYYKCSYLRSSITIRQIENLKISFTLRNLSNNAKSVSVQANMNGQPTVYETLGDAINNKEYNITLALNQTGVEVYCYVIVEYYDNAEETYTISNLTYEIDDVVKNPYATRVVFSQGNCSFETIKLDAVAKKKDIQSIDVLRNKKILFFGDSITDIDTGISVYPKVIEDYYGTDNTSYAVAGSGFNCDSTNSQQISKWGASNNIIAQINKAKNDVSSENVDVIFVSAGTNDFGLNTSGSFGSKNDITTEPETPTIYGNIAKSMRLLKEYYPYAKIFYITPIPRFTNGLPYRMGNGRGFSLTHVRDAIKYCCEYYSIPCLDMYSLSGLYSGNGQLLYWSDAPVYLHPSNKYHEEVYAPMVADFIKQMFNNYV